MTDMQCPHPVTRQFGWFACDGTLCMACCECGAVLAGAIEIDSLDQACALNRAREAIVDLQRTLEASHAV